MAIFARSEQKRYLKAGIVPPRKNALNRRLVEPLLNAFGMFITMLGALLGASRMMGYHDKLMGGLAGKAREPFDPKLPQLEETRRLMAHVEELCGTHPAVLCLMSHPPVLPESLGLNVEMARQGLLALHSLRPMKGHARILLAVDAYALDMLGGLEEGLYAGFMGTYHLGLDRLAQHRYFPSRWFLRKAAWWRLPWRTSRYLAGGQSLAMVLSGGVPVTARVLYASREFLWRLRKSRASHPHSTPSSRRVLTVPAADEYYSPKEIIQRLERQNEDFAAFARSGFVGPRLRRNAWRMMEAWIVARISGVWPSGASAASSSRQGSGNEKKEDGLAHGAVTDVQLDCLHACAAAMGFAETRISALLDDFREEFSRETPYRERFFLFLLHRVLSRGRPIILLPMSHQLDGASMKLSWSSPIALLKFSQEGLRICRGPGSPDELVPLERFARNFVRVHYT